MKILHISDIHLENPCGLDDKYILGRFRDFLSSLVSVMPLDLMVITGDLRNNENNPASVSDIITVITDVATAAKITDNIHIVPGNHDLTRVGDEKERVGNIRKKYQYKHGTFSNSGKTLVEISNRFDDFFWKFCNEFYTRDNPWVNNHLNPHYSLSVDNNGYIFINSSLTCIDSDSDGNLIIGLSYVSDLIDGIIFNNPNTERIMLFAHHPLHNLHNREIDTMQSTLRKHSNIIFNWFCGDAHSNKVEESKGIDIFQGGSLLGASSTIPEFSIYELDDTSLKRRIYRFIPHLNNSVGGWKRVYPDDHSLTE